MCLGALGTCECYDGYTGLDCHYCAPTHVRVGAACVFLPGALVLCTDGVRNGDEEGVDCGGSKCTPCDAFAGTHLAARSPTLAIILVNIVVAAALGVATVVILRNTQCGKRYRCFRWCQAEEETSGQCGLVCLPVVANLCKLCATKSSSNADPDWECSKHWRQDDTHALSTVISVRFPPISSSHAHGSTHTPP